MEVIPAIDLKDGYCVRLFQGDFDKETVYSTDPVAVAKRWEQAGASRIHVVDLDGAAQGIPVNSDAIERIVNKVNIPIQVGGGIRNLDTLSKYLALGVRRVVLGTAVVDFGEFVRDACNLHQESVVIGLDARDGQIATSGWQHTTNLNVIELVEKVESLGAFRLIYTDISRDGTMQGPNIEAVRNVVHKAQIPVISSGGISTIADLLRLQALGVEGAIVGRALYTGDIDLHQAIGMITKDGLGQNGQ